MLFNDGDTLVKEACYVAKSDPVEDVVCRVKRIFDAKHEQPDSTNLHHSKETWISRIHLRLLRAQQKNIEKTIPYLKCTRHALEPRRVSMGNRFVCI